VTHLLKIADSHASRGLSVIAEVFVCVYKLYLFNC